MIRMYSTDDRVRPKFMSSHSRGNARKTSNFNVAGRLFLRMTDQSGVSVGKHAERFGRRHPGPLCEFIHVEDISRTQSRSFDDLRLAYAPDWTQFHVKSELQTGHGCSM